MAKIKRVRTNQYGGTWKEQEAFMSLRYDVPRAMNWSKNVCMNAFRDLTPYAGQHRCSSLTSAE